MPGIRDASQHAPLITSEDRVFVLTGAGISAESGLATFRGSGGLWNGFRVEQVATPEAWQTDPETRLELLLHPPPRRPRRPAQPRPPHPRHNRAEARRPLLPLHPKCRRPPRARRLPARPPHARQPLSVALRALRPALRRHFRLPHEPPTSASTLPNLRQPGATPHRLVRRDPPRPRPNLRPNSHRATVLLVVGTSGSVYPAAGFVNLANHRGIRTVYVGPEEPGNAAAFDTVLLGTAVEVLPTLLAV